MRRFKIIYVFLLPGALAASVWFYSLAISPDYRLPNERETFFQYAAVEANVPKLCEKISPKALVIAGFSSDGHRIYLSRSQCFYETAVRHADRLLCLKVKSVHNIFHWGYKISTLNCLFEVGEKEAGLSSAIIPNAKIVMKIFNEMGYITNDAVNALPVEPMVNIGRVFSDLSRQPDVMRRLKAVLELKNEIPLEDFELLSDMLAMHTHDIKWCNNIRPGIRHPAEKASDRKWNNDFRGYCIHHAAIGSGNEKYCDALPNEPVVPLQHEIWWPANECRSSVKFNKQKAIDKRASFHGYYVPEDEKQTTRLFKLLGYALPKDSDQPMEKLARRYRYLLGDIGAGDISRDDARVKTLLQRLKQLKEE